MSVGSDCTPHLETPRLTGHPVNDGDVGYLRHILGNPQTMRWLSPDGKAASDEKMHRIASRLSGHWKAHGFGVRLFFLRGGGAFAGWCGIRHYLVEGKPELELLYALRHSLWGDGLGREMAQASLAEAQSTLAASSVVAFTLPDNKASQGVMRSCGMVYEADITVAGLPHVLYRRRWDDTV